MRKLTDTYYICEVLGGSVDPQHRGGVRVKVLGITDTWEDADQPYVYPVLMGGIQQVPQKGYFLRVCFRNGDINCGEYYGMSSTPSLLPVDYVGSYPDVAVSNLGEDNYFYTHNRNTHISEIQNAGNDTNVTWDAAGAVTMTCGKAHEHSGMDAKSGGGANVQQVLTEGTIDIFTCMPVGHNRNNTGLGQGSEYLGVSHVSNLTIDAFHGTANVEPLPQTTTPDEPTTVSDIETRVINGASGEYNVDFYPSGKFIKRTDKKYTRIILCHTQGDAFGKAAKKSMTTNSCVHYLVGKKEGIPAMDGESGDSDGFVQMVDIENDVGLFSGNRIGDDKANLGAVIVQFVGSATDPYTDYQKKVANDIIAHVRKAADNQNLEIVTPDDFAGMPNPSMSMKLHILM